MSPYEKPRPVIDMASQPFWDAAKHHELIAQKCKRCGHKVFQPNTVCTKCLSPDLEWMKLSGKGKVWSFVVFHQKYYPGFAKDIPYNVAVVETEEGYKMITNLMGSKNEDIRIGMPVEVAFDDVADDLTLIKFRPI